MLMRPAILLLLAGALLLHGIVAGAMQTEATVWDAVAHPPAGFELRCRGGAGFQFRNLGFHVPPGTVDIRVALAMTFNAAEHAAGATGAGLEPGTCAWIDRPVNAREPREMHFVAPAFAQLMQRELDTSAAAAERFPDVRAIATYLADGNHFWTFTAVNTNRGYFDASAHRSWTPRTASPPETPRSPAPAPPAPPPGPAKPRPAWEAEAGVSGGLRGGGSSVSITSDGSLQVSQAPGKTSCSVQVPPEAVRRVEDAMRASAPASWRRAYVNPKNPGGCCDQFMSSLSIHREGGSGPKDARTSWHSDSEKVVPGSISRLFDTIWSLRAQCPTKHP